MVYPFPRIRAIPLRLSRGLASIAIRNRAFVAVYIGVVFVLIPLLGIVIFK